MFYRLGELLKAYEAIAVWLEGIALVAILLLDWREYHRQGKERTEDHRAAAEQRNIWRKQIHSDRVAEIFKALRRFEHFVVHGGGLGEKIGPGKDFSEFGDISNKGGRISQEYLDLQEAYYLSYLVSDRLATFMKQRMADADELQRVPDTAEYARRLAEFYKNWDVYKLATKMRELS
jgi:hypothetical protein